MGNVNDLLIELINKPEYHQELSAGGPSVEAFAASLEYAIDTKDNIAIDSIIQATKHNEIHAIQLLTVIITRAMLALKLIQYLNDHPLTPHKRGDRLRFAILSYACTLKSCEKNMSYTATWEKYANTIRKPKKHIRIDDPEARRLDAISRLSVMFTLHEVAVKEAFQRFDLKVSKELIKYSTADPLT